MKTFVLHVVYLPGNTDQWSAVIAEDVKGLESNIARHRCSRGECPLAYDAQLFLDLVHELDRVVDQGAPQFLLDLLRKGAKGNVRGALRVIEDHHAGADKVLLVELCRLIQLVRVPQHKVGHLPDEHAAVVDGLLHELHLVHL